MLLLCAANALFSTLMCKAPAGSPRAAVDKTGVVLIFSGASYLGRTQMWQVKE